MTDRTELTRTEIRDRYAARRHAAEDRQHRHLIFGLAILVALVSLAIIAVGYGLAQIPSPPPPL